MKGKTELLLSALCFLLFPYPSFGAELSYPSDSEILMYSIGAVVGLILLVLLLRNLFCWYWKINQRLAVLEEIRDLLVKESQRLEREREIRAATPRSDPETVCTQCGARYSGDLRGRFCDACGAKL